MATRTWSTLFAALLFCTAGAASAQTIYKVVNDEGRTSFSDQPSSLVSEPPAAKTSLPRKRGGKVDTDEAARRLKQARLEREQGAEPRPGELKPGTAHEVNYRYWQRQEKLRLNVESALRRSNATLRPQLVSMSR